MVRLEKNQGKENAICAELSAGASLRSACKTVGDVSPQSVLRWVEADKAFSEQYAQARARGYALLADQIIDISDDSEGDTFIDDNGIVRTDAERVARSKLRVESRKWMLSKMLPKVYGDKTVLEGPGPNGEHQFRLIEVREMPWTAKP